MGVVVLVGEVTALLFAVAEVAAAAGVVATVFGLLAVVALFAPVETIVVNLLRIYI